MRKLYASLCLEELGACKKNTSRKTPLQKLKVHEGNGDLGDPGLMIWKET